MMSNGIVVSLQNVINSIEVKDMNYEFFYKRVRKPDNTLSDLFDLNYREHTMQEWITCNGLLSQNFKVVKTEKLIEAICTQLNTQLQGEKHYRSDTSVKSTFLLSDYILDLPEENDVDKIIFQLVTNIESDISLMTRCALSFNIINGFSGNHALKLNFGFMKNIRGRRPDETEDTVVSSNNPFLLDEFTKIILHDDNNIDISIAEITNVQQCILTKINLFKSIPVLDEWLTEFERIFPKKFVKKFLSMFQDLPNEYRNIYYACFIWGVLLDLERNIQLEIKLRTFVKSYIDTVNRVS